MSLDLCKIINFPKIADARGNLTFVEGGRHVPFEMRRVFYLYDVPVEPDALHFLDPSRIEEAITPRTRAILPVHLYGLSVDLDPILAIARARGHRVLEDGAQCHGARYRGRRIGAHGDAVAWSFYPGKNLGALGDVGVVTTDDPTIADRIRVLRNYGSRVKCVNEVQGFNSRLDPLQAAALRVKPRHLDEWNARRALLDERGHRELPGVSFLLCEVSAHRGHAPHLLVTLGTSQDERRKRLAATGIATLHPRPVAATPAARRTGRLHPGGFSSRRRKIPG